jgi:hypothetical protein
MMQFLRKHQTKLFIVIAIMTAASYAFFGNTSNVSVTETQNKKLGKTFNGHVIYEKDLKALTHFLSMGAGDIFKSDLIDTGVFALLAEHYFEEIQGDFQERLQKAQTATFYSHPEASFLSAMQVWNRFYPQLPQNLRAVQMGSVDPKTFLAYAKLYLDQQVFPPELLRTFLLYEQQNYAWIKPDYQLSDTRKLALFGYQTLEEWFGSRFSDILGKFILNTAALAEKRGYKVTHREVHDDFMKRCGEAAKKSIQRDVTGQDVNNFMRLQLQIMGLDESHAVRLWRNVMLVHRFFQDIGQGVLIDSIPYEQFTTFADAKACVEVYQLPEPLRLKDFRSMLKVQYYLEAISPKGKQSIADLPRQLYSVDEIEKKHPQLITSRYELEVAKATQEDILSKLSLKYMWDFETSDRGWALITKEFPVLNKQEAVTVEGREKILDSCDPELRKKVDLLARQSLIKNHPDWIETALQAKPYERVVVAIRSKGAVAPFSDVEDTALLRTALQKAEVGEVFQFISPSEQTYYLIKVLQKPAQKQVMTLQEALENDWLGTLLDEKLEAMLVEARKKESALYKAADGSWKPFSQVRDDVGAYVYSDLLKMISETPLMQDEYAAKRFQAMMSKAKASIQKEREASKFLAPTGETLVDQWTLSKRYHEIKRSDTTELSKSEMFAKEVGSWSSVVTPLGGNIAFFHLLERSSADLTIQDQVSIGQKLIGQDVMRQRVQTLLDEIGAL